MNLSTGHSRPWVGGCWAARFTKTAAADCRYLVILCVKRHIEIFIIKLSRSQYVIHPSWAAGWYWTRPGSIDMRRSSNIRLIPQSRFQRNITDGDFEFLKFLSHDDLTARSVLKSISLLTNSSCFNLAEQDVWTGQRNGEGDWWSQTALPCQEVLFKSSCQWNIIPFFFRQPILDAMDQKRKRQQNFWVICLQKNPQILFSTYLSLPRFGWVLLVSFILVLPIQLGPQQILPGLMNYHHNSQSQLPWISSLS